MDDKPRKPNTHPNRRDLLQIKCAEEEIESALNRLRRLKRRDIFEQIELILPLEVCIDRAEGLLKIQKILTERVERVVK